MPAVYPDLFEVQVRHSGDDVRLVAVVELVSPGNKDRPPARRAFAAKSVAYLNRGVGLVVVDFVTDRHFNLHNELLPMLAVDATYAMAEESHLYSVGYRPIQRGDVGLIEVWLFVLSVGSALPVVPLCLRRFRAIPLNLEALYEEACRRGRI